MLINETRQIFYLIHDLSLISGCIMVVVTAFGTGGNAQVVQETRVAE